MTRLSPRADAAVAAPSELRLRGPRLTLRPVRESDVDGRYLSWMRDPAVVRYLEARFSTPTREGVLSFVRAQAADPATRFLAMELDARHIGNIKLGPIDRHHGTADVGLLVGEKDCWGRGYGTEAIRLVTDHAFSSLGLRRLTAGCYGRNEGSIKAVLKADWTIEARLRAHYLSDDGPDDRVLLSRFRPGDEP
ncbi:MAG: GNAT family N-acetyltransferase [Methanobacteriota archaeon]